MWGLRHFERQSHEVHVADWRRELGAGAVVLHASPAHGSKKDVVTTGKTAARATNVTDGVTMHALRVAAWLMSAFLSIPTVQSSGWRVTKCTTDEEFLSTATSVLKASGPLSVCVVVPSPGSSRLAALLVLHSDGRHCTCSARPMLALSPSLQQE